MRGVLVALVATVFLLTGQGATADNSNPSAHHVRAYTKKDGTYVHEHEAKNPNRQRSASSSKHHSPKKFGRVASQEQRSTATRSEFQREHPCPSTGSTTGACPGYVKDHIKPLCKGGPDVPSNMQWQTIAEGKAKDRVECR